MPKLIATASISVLIIFVYILELINPSFMLNTFSLDSSLVTQHPWTIITYIFIHDPSALGHIFSNMFAFVIFGAILENIIGTRRFVMVFLAAGVTSAIASLAFYPSSIGASGAIFGIMGTLGIIRPKLIVWAMGIPVPMIGALVIWALLDFFGFFTPDQIGHAAHLAGLATGIVYGFIIRGIYMEEHRKKEKVLDESEIKNWEDGWMRH